MSKIKNIVKVMNIHSLLRVDKSRKVADQFLVTENELTNLIDQIYFNENLILDKKVISPNPNGIVLNIYIANDLGFCGNFNSQVISALRKDKESNKVIIGKKINFDVDNCLLKIEKEQFEEYINEINSIIYDMLLNKKIKEINIIYNHYHNINNFEFMCKKLFPVELVSESIGKHDFVIESDINNLFVKLITLYICYEIEMLEKNSFAAENIMRQRITNESLKKIEEIEVEKFLKTRKEKKAKQIKKQLSDYRIIDKR